MSILNSLLRGLFDTALYPFRELHPMVGIALVSLIIGIGMLWVFKLTSNQTRLAEVKSKILAGIFEIRLFNDDLRNIFRAMGDILRHNLSYMGLAFVPLLWMIVPFVLIVAQLQFHYGYQGLKLGESVLVEVELNEGAGETRPQVDLVAPQGLTIEAGPMWIPAKRELSWRIAAETPGTYDLELKAGAETYTKSVDVTESTVRRSPSRLAPGFWNQLLYPAEDPLPASAPISAIYLQYPHGNAGFEGWESELTWMLFFLILSIIFAFALRKPLGVTI